MTAGKARASFSDYAVDTASRLARSRDDECGIDAYPNPWKRYHDDKLLEGVNFLSNMYSIRNELLRRQLKKQGNAENGAKNAKAAPSGDPTPSTPSTPSAAVRIPPLAIAPPMSTPRATQNTERTSAEKRLEEKIKRLERQIEILKNPQSQPLSSSIPLSASTRMYKNQPIQGMTDEEKNNAISDLLNQLRKLSGELTEEEQREAMRTMQIALRDYFQSILKKEETEVVFLKKDKLFDAIVALADEDIVEVAKAITFIQIDPTLDTNWRDALVSLLDEEEQADAINLLRNKRILESYQLISPSVDAWSKLIAPERSKALKDQRKKLEDARNEGESKKKREEEERTKMMQKKAYFEEKGRDAYNTYKDTWKAVVELLGTNSGDEVNTQNTDVNELYRGAKKEIGKWKSVLEAMIDEVMQNKFDGTDVTDEQRKELDSTFVAQFGTRPNSITWPKEFRSWEYVGMLVRLDAVTKMQSRDEEAIRAELTKKYEKVVADERAKMSSTKASSATNLNTLGVQSSSASATQPKLSLADIRKMGRLSARRNREEARQRGEIVPSDSDESDQSNPSSPANKPPTTDQPPPPTMVPPPKAPPKVPPPMITPPRAPPPPTSTTPSTARSARTESDLRGAMMAELQQRLRGLNQKLAQEGGQPGGIKAYASWLPGIWKMLGVKTPN